MGCYCTFRTDTGTTYQAVEASMTLTRGVTPSLCTLTVPDLDASGLSPVQEGGTWIQGANGTLEFGDGVNGSVVFFGCRVMEFDVAKDADAQDYHTTMRVADRRWRWAGVPFTFREYNTRDVQGTVVDVGDWKKSSKQIARNAILELLSWEGDGSYDIQLPDGTVSSEGTNATGRMPYFKWDRVPPAAALQEVCEFNDACVTITPNTNLIRVFADGSTLPEPASAVRYSREETKYLGNPIPEYYAVFGGRRRIECDLPLTPVVLDTDGSLKSYRVHDSGGTTLATNAATYESGTRDCSWLPIHLPVGAEISPNQFSLSPKFAGTTSAQVALRKEIKKCAAQSYLRWFQLPGTATLYTADGTEYLPAPALWRMVVLERNAKERIGEDVRYARAQVFGTGWAKHEATDSTVSATTYAGIFDGAVGYDKSAGLVKLTSPVITYHAVGRSTGTSTEAHPGTLWLRCVIEDQPSVFYGTSSRLNGSYASVESGYFFSESHDDLVYEYGSNGTNNGTATNLDLMGSLAQSYIDVASGKQERILLSNLGKTITYPGIHAFGCDGYYQQVSWTLGVDKPPQTVLSNDTDHDIRASADAVRQAVWQGHLWRQRQNDAQYDANSQYYRDGGDTPKEEQ